MKPECITLMNIGNQLNWLIQMCMELDLDRGNIIQLTQSEVLFTQEYL